MLKIKDNVDLKELEKYGFYDSLGIYQRNIEQRMSDGILWNDFRIAIDKTTRIIRFSTGCESKTTNLNVIYDLIKDGLVEKVGE
jgi:hypothetical protein